MQSDLSESQQQKVFQIMEVCGLEGPAAISLLRRCNFNLENAIQMHFNPGASIPPAHREAPVIPPQHDDPPPFQDYQSDEQDDDPEYVRYRNYKNRGMNFQAKYGQQKTWGQSIKGFLPSFLRHEQPGGETAINRINQIYRQNKVKFVKGTFMQNMQETTKEKFPLLVFFLDFKPNNEKIVKEILTNEQFFNHINVNFRNLALDTRIYQFQPPLAALVKKQTDCPGMILFRIDICDEIKVMERFKFEGFDIAAAKKRLEKAKSLCIRAEMNQSIHQKKYFAVMTGQPVPKVMTLDQRLKLNEERRIRKEQQAEFQQANKIDMQKKKQQNTQIQKENEKAQKLQKTMQNRKKLRQIMTQDKEGVMFKLRLPSGSSIIRTVSPKHKVQYLFDFIESQEEAGFENDHDRKFQIIRPYDRLALSQNKEKTISQVFGDDGNENLIVNEL